MTAADKLLAVLREKASTGPWETSVEELGRLAHMSARGVFRARQALSRDGHASFVSRAGVPRIACHLGASAVSSDMTSDTSDMTSAPQGEGGTRRTNDESLLLSCKALNNNHNNNNRASSGDFASTSDTDLGASDTSALSEVTTSALAANARTIEHLVLENASLRARLEGVSLTETSGEGGHGDPLGLAGIRGAHAVEPARTHVGDRLKTGASQPSPFDSGSPQTEEPRAAGVTAPSTALAPEVTGECRRGSSASLNPANYRGPLDTDPGPSLEEPETRRRHLALLLGAGATEAAAEVRVKDAQRYDERVRRASVQELEQKIKRGWKPKDGSTVDDYLRGMLRRAEQPLGAGLSWRDFDAAKGPSKAPSAKVDEEREDRLYNEFMARERQKTGAP